MRLAVGEADTLSEAPFVKLSCEDVTDQLLLVYASIRARTNGVVILLV